MGGGVEFGERQRQLHACTYGIGVSEGDVPYQKLKMLYFETEIL